MCPKIHARVAFDGVQFLGMRMALVIEPELVVEPNRMAIPRRIRIVGMLRVHENLPVAVVPGAAVQTTRERQWSDA